MSSILEELLEFDTQSFLITGKIYQIIAEEMDFRGSFLEEKDGNLFFECNEFDLRIKCSNVRRIDPNGFQIWIGQDVS